MHGVAGATTKCDNAAAGEKRRADGVRVRRSPHPTYHKILEEAVRELKDEHFKELFADAQEGSHALARGSRRDQSDDDHRDRPHHADPQQQ
jgi:hypothetical protein